MNSLNEQEVNNQEDNEYSSIENKLMQTVIDYSNYILIVSLLLINVIINLVIVEDGSLKLNDFGTYIWFDWILWIIMTFVPPIITVIVRTVFQKEGISKAKQTYSNLILEHYSYLKNDLSVKVRSEKEFLRENATKKSIKTLLSTLILSFFSGSLAAGLDTAGWLALALNLLVTLVVGFLAFTDSYNYGVSELKTWYVIEIERLANLSYDRMIASGKYLPEVK